MKRIAVLIVLITTIHFAQSQTISLNDTICLQKKTYKAVLSLAVDAECSQAELQAAKVELNLSKEKVKRKNRVILGGAAVIVIIETVRQLTRHE